MRVRLGERFARPLVVAAGALLLALPCALGAQEIDCDKTNDQEVRSVKFDGNQTLSDDELSARVLTTPSAFTRRYFGWLGAGVKRCLPDVGLGPDVAALKQFHQDNGFYRAKIDAQVARQGGNRVAVTFKIDEGVPSVVDTLSIVGLDSVVSREEITRDLQLRPGERFGRLRLLADIDTITSRLRNAGYPRASVFQAYKAGPTTTRAEVYLTVAPGPRARFGTIAITRVGSGLELGREADVDSSVVLRLLGFQSGNWYSDRALTDASRNLYNLGIYRHVAADLDTTRAAPDTVADVVVDVREDYIRQISLEEGWANLDCFRIDGQYADKNFADKAWRLDLTGRVSKLGHGSPTRVGATRTLCGQFLNRDSIGSSKLNYHVGASIHQPTIFGGHWIPAYSLYTERRGEYLAYLRTTYIGADVSATREIGDRMPLRVGYSLEYGETRAEPVFLCVLFTVCDPAGQADLQGRLPLAVASVSFQRTRTDNLVEPRNGYSLAAETRASAHIIGSDPSLRFFKATGDLALYRALASRITAAARFRAGFLTGGRTAGTKLPPPQERLYAGGANSVRGFQQNELGALIYIVDSTSINFVPLSPTTVALVSKPEARERRTVPVGGNTLSVINLELRIRDPFFPDVLEYVPFMDAGQLFTEGGTNVSNLKRLFVTPGLGVRYFSPVGPIQANAGYNPSKRRAGQAFYTPVLAGDRAPLFCVTGPGVPVVPVHATNGQVDQPLSSDCPESFVPFRSNNFFNRFVLSLSIGTSF